MAREVFSDPGGPIPDACVVPLRFKTLLSWIFQLSKEAATTR
jgi:hypothetical protein